MKKTYKYRIYPSKTQEQKLETALDQACFLYNQMLDIKQQIYLGEEISLTEFDMNNIIKDFQTPALHSQVKQNIPKRISEAYKHFFRRVKSGETPGFPKFKKRIFYSSITYPQYKGNIKEGKIRLSKIGNMPIIEHRKIDGRTKTLTVKKENNEWYVTVSCIDVPIETTVPEFTSEVEGIDVGIKEFLVCSDNTEVANPKWLRNNESTIKKHQRRLSRKKKGSINRKKARIKLSKYHSNVGKQREDFHKKLARNLAMKIEYIGVETLNIKNMVKNHCLAKSISDAGWGKFFSYLKYYKTIFPGAVVEIGTFEPTSKTCSDCGHKQDMPLKERTFCCESCGMIKDRDLNASINIKKLAVKKLIAQEIKLNTVGHTEIYAFGDSVRLQSTIVEPVAVVVELGTTQREALKCR